MMKSTLLILSGLLQMAGCCSFSDGSTDWKGYQYSLNCIGLAQVSGELSGDRALAICLLQRNSIQKMLDCGFWDGRKMYTEPVVTGSAADRLQLTRDLPSVKDSNNDGLVKVTPKDVLLTVAELCERNCGVARKIRSCPYFDKQQFKACLCCEGVTPEDFDCLNDCLGAFGKIVHPDNWISPDFSCISLCPYWTDTDFKRTSQVSACQWYYMVKNGVWQGNRCLSAKRQLADDDWDEDTDDDWDGDMDGEILTLTATTYSQTLTETPSTTTYTFSTSALFSNGLSTTSAETSQRNFDTTTYTGATATTTYIASSAAGSLSYGCWTSVIAAVYAYLLVWLQ